MRAENLINWRHGLFLGLDLKADLRRLDEHFTALPEDVKDKGLYHFAARPPLDTSFLVAQLWDRHLRPIWREDRRTVRRDPERDAEIIRRVNRLAEATVPAGSPKPDSSDDIDYLIVQRKVIPRKGKWKRFPPEIEHTPNVPTRRGSQSTCHSKKSSESIS